jgi:hypothetical protein
MTRCDMVIEIIRETSAVVFYIPRHHYPKESAPTPSSSVIVLTEDVNKNCEVQNVC